MCSTVDISDVVGHKHIEQGTSHGKEGFVGEYVPIFAGVPLQFFAAAQQVLDGTSKHIFLDSNCP